MSQEAIVIDVGKKSALIRICGVIIKVNAKQQDQFLAKKLLNNQENIIPLCLKAMGPSC